MKKIQIKPQATKASWHEGPLGVFTLKIVARNSEAASNFRRYLPLIERFLLLGWNGDNKNEILKEAETK